MRSWEFLQEGVRACPFWVVSRPRLPPRPGRGTGSARPGNLGEAGAAQRAESPGCPRVPGLAWGQPTASTSFYGLCVRAWTGGERDGEQMESLGNRERERDRTEIGVRHAGGMESKRYRDQRQSETRGRDRDIDRPRDSERDRDKR